MQGTLSFEGDRRSYLEDADAELYGDLDGYSLFDLSAGIRKNNWALDLYVKNVFDERNQLSKFASCVVPALRRARLRIPNTRTARST